MNIAALQVGRSIPDINLIQRDGTLKKIRDIKIQKIYFCFGRMTKIHIKLIFSIKFINFLKII